MTSDLLRPAEVARRLGVSRSWLYEAAKSGVIPCVRLGGDDGPLRFVEEDIDAWLDRARRNDRQARGRDATGVGAGVPTTAHP